MMGCPNGIDRVATDFEAKRVWLAQRANLKQELLAPADALLEYSEIIIAEAEERGCEPILEDLGTIHSSCLQLRETANHILDASQPPSDEKKARHGLINTLNPIKQYCEMLLKDAENQVFLDVFVPDLSEMLRLVKQLLQGIGEMFRFTQANGGAAPAVNDAPLPHLPPCVSPWTAPPAETGLILVVDDNEINRSILCRQLRREGHQTMQAANGRIALQMAHEYSFDLLLLDMLMPELDGFETLRRLKADENLCGVPVIMISALDEIDTAARCIEYGAEDYLTKPWNAILLRARVGACLEKKRLRDREARHLEEIHRGKERVDELLRVILPDQVLPELIETGTVRPRHVENVAVLFADVVGFTRYCGQHMPEEVVDRLQTLIEAWEAIAPRHHVLKIKTIGDALMAACGLLEEPPDDPVCCAVRFGLELIQVTRRLATDWNVRVGVHVGPVVAGVVGHRQYLFDLWGDTVNTASRMESNGRANRVNLSPEAWARITHCANGTLNRAEVKGIGWTDMMLLENFDTSVSANVLGDTRTVARDA